MSDSPTKRSSLNITLDDSFEIDDLSKSHIFSVVFGSPVSMTGFNSNSGSDATNTMNYAVSIDKTVEHVIRMVPEFSEGVDEKLVGILYKCMRVSSRYNSGG